eukprot:1186424-Prorocentrum_minimum.AAC.2
MLAQQASTTPVRTLTLLVGPRGVGDGGGGVIPDGPADPLQEQGGGLRLPPPPPSPRAPPRGSATPPHIHLLLRHP